jgi:hypothetical protein
VGEGRGERARGEGDDRNIEEGVVTFIERRGWKSP